MRKLTIWAAVAAVAVLVATFAALSMLSSRQVALADIDDPLEAGVSCTGDAAHIHGTKVTGTSVGEKIDCTGSTADLNIQGLGGNDTLTGGLGEDHNHGGPGMDTCNVGPGDHAVQCETYAVLALSLLHRWSSCCLVAVWLLSGCCLVVLWLFSGCCRVVLLIRYSRLKNSPGLILERVCNVICKFNKASFKNGIKDDGILAVFRPR